MYWIHREKQKRQGKRKHPGKPMEKGKRTRQIGLSPSVVGVWVSVAAYGVFRGLFEVNAHASLFDVVPSEHRSTCEGLMTMIAFLLGSLSPLMIGALSDKYGVRGFEIGFSILGGGYLLGAASIATSFFFTFKRDRIAEE